MLVHKRVTKLSDWVSVSERTVKVVGSKELEIFHSLQISDYVSIVVINEDGQIPLVRQYRPALDDWTIELPGGLLERGESPEACAQRELLEETGLVPVRSMKPLPCLFPDTGRLENRLWGFFVEAKPSLTNWTRESGVEPIFVGLGELEAMIISGKFNHALHVALIGLSIIKGFLKLENDDRFRTISG